MRRHRWRRPLTRRYRPLPSREDQEIGLLARHMAEFLALSMPNGGSTRLVSIASVEPDDANDANDANDPNEYFDDFDDHMNIPVEDEDDFTQPIVHERPLQINSILSPSYLMTENHNSRAAGVPRRSSLQVIEHILKFKLNGTTATAATGPPSPKTPILINGSNSNTTPSANNNNVLTQSLLDCVTIENRTPLQLAYASSSSHQKTTLLVCMCDGDMPGAFWTLAGPAADLDEVDLMASSSLYPVLHPRVAFPMPLDIQRAILIPEAFLFRPSEGSKICAEPANWPVCGVYLAPFLPNRYCNSPNLSSQFRLMVETALQHRYKRIIIPFGRWARTNGNALEVALRLTQALERMPYDENLSIVIASPPEQAHWQHSINSVIASAKTRRNEQQTPPQAPTRPPPRPVLPSVVSGRSRPLATTPAAPPTPDGVTPPIPRRDAFRSSVPRPPVASPTTRHRERHNRHRTTTPASAATAAPPAHTRHRRPPHPPPSSPQPSLSDRILAAPSQIWNRITNF